MPHRELDTDVMSEAVDRMQRVYRDGHRVVVSFSGGKDSGACVEVCKIAAEREDRLPVEVAMRDEEIMFPGTFEYSETIARDPATDFHWIIANQPIVNCFNRASPYFWVFDELVEPEDWVRLPPTHTGVLDDVPNARAYQIPENNIGELISPARFPPEEAPAGEDAELFVVMGLRVDESPARRMGLHSSGGYLTKTDPQWGFRKCRPIYDWTDGDLWLAYQLYGWPYNEAYDVMHRMGVTRRDLRIAPPTLSPAGIDQLAVARKAWPLWWERVAARLDGVNTASMFGRHAVEPDRRYGETWEECFYRECVETAPDWIAKRALDERDHVLRQHQGHAATPFPQKRKCSRCPHSGSWKGLAKITYMGDPFSMRTYANPPVEPEFFREGTGTWGGGAPTF